MFKWRLVEENRYFYSSRKGKGFKITFCFIQTILKLSWINKLHITWSLQEGEQFVKKIGGVFAFKIKDGPGGKEATWIVDVKNGKGSVAVNSG